MASSPRADAAPLSLSGRVERVHAAVAVALSLAAFLLLGQPQWSGMAAGALVGAVNFRALAFLTERLIGGETSSRHTAIALLLFKFTLLAGALGGIVTWLKPDGVTFLVGLTLAPVCLVAVVLSTRRRAEPLPEAS